MPVYEYACEKCRREFEVEQRISDDPIKSCPHCRSRKVKRLISRTSFVLKGSGWYSDLYSSASGKKADDKGEAKPAADAGGDKAAASATTSESKKETKSEANGKAKDKSKAA